MLACDPDLTVADTIKDLALCYVDLITDVVHHSMHTNIKR